MAWPAGVDASKTQRFTMAHAGIAVLAPDTEKNTFPNSTITCETTPPLEVDAEVGHGETSIAKAAVRITGLKKDDLSDLCLQPNDALMRKPEMRRSGAGSQVLIIGS